ncbi:MAG: protein KlaA [Pseudomonas sp.]
MSTTPLSLERLKADTLPALFQDPEAVAQYGSTEETGIAMRELSEVMEAGSVQSLADSIQTIVGGLGDADPQKIAQKPSFLDRLLGRELEREVRYRVARHSLDTLIAHAETHAVGARHTVKTIDRLLAKHSEDAARIRVLLQAGREYLAENPQAGIYTNPEAEFDRPRERFARKLANLATLLTSHELSVMQMKLARAQAVDILDRFSETVSILVPVWRQHTLALITTKNMSPAMIAAATQAHQALMRSLTNSLDSIEK